MGKGSGPIVVLTGAGISAVSDKFEEQIVGPAGEKVLEFVKVNPARMIFEKNHEQWQGERNLGGAKLRRKRQINPA